MALTIYVSASPEEPRIPLIDRIEKAMLLDDEDRGKQSELLLSIYEQASAQEKSKIDACLICICGWSLPSLIKQGTDNRTVGKEQ